MITGRHVAVTPALRSYIETRMERLDRYGLKLGTLQILLSVEKIHHIAELVGVVQGKRLQAKTSTGEMYASIDEVVDKLGAQLRKMKDRRANHKFGDLPRLRVRTRRASPVAPPVVDVQRPTLETLSLEAAVTTLNDGRLNVLVFLSASSGVVQVLQRSADGTVSLIDPVLPRARASHGRA